MTKKCVNFTEPGNCYPIKLSEHQDCWQEWFEEEYFNILIRMPTAYHYNILHIGSTAINNIKAVPIIDIAISMFPPNLELAKDMLIDNCGYKFLGESERGMLFTKGYTDEGLDQKVFHLCLSFLYQNALSFRNCLNDNVELAKEYEKIKVKASEANAFDGETYLKEKLDFINKITNKKDC